LATVKDTLLGGRGAITTRVRTRRGGRPCPVRKGEWLQPTWVG
jgi:hypothetical protein